MVAQLWKIIVKAWDYTKLCDVFGLYDSIIFNGAGACMHDTSKVPNELANGPDSNLMTMSAYFLRSHERKKIQIQAKNRGS